jgi:ubiquinone/menaquinone biosynthesis C-methylase UbiE
MSESMNPEVVTQFEHETWSRCAESYLDTFAGMTRETIPLLLEAAHIGHGSHVLEIGSGPGHVAHALTEAGAIVTGVDFSAQMVTVARRQNPGITFQEANAEHLPFEARTFDAVVSNFVVHHLARPTVVFQEVCRVLKPGGHFVFSVFGAPEAQSSIGAFFTAVQAHHTLEALPNGPLFGVTDRRVYEPMITAGGLADFQLDTHEIVWRSETLDTDSAWLLGLGQHGSAPTGGAGQDQSNHAGERSTLRAERPVCVSPCHSAWQGHEAVAPRAEQARAGDGLRLTLRSSA